MKYDIQNFIYTSELALSEDECNEIINLGEERLANPPINIEIKDDSSRGEGSEQFSRGKLDRDDSQLFIPEALGEIYKKVADVVFQHTANYAEQISSVKGVKLSLSGLKFQKTRQGDVGFAPFHIEQGNNCGNRFLVWMIYLNDVTDGGDTEFLYQRMKFQPKAGTIVIWPAGLTHPHRGNPPYSNDKYILTSWLTIEPEKPSMIAGVSE